MPSALLLITISILAVAVWGRHRAQRRRAAIAALAPPGRRMGMFEQAFDCMHHIGAFVIVEVVRIDGPLDASTLRRALDAVQRMHPLLSVHVAGPDGLFQADGTEPIPLRLVTRDGDERWKAEAVDELHRPIPYGKHPLVRAVWIGGRDEGELLLASNHAILDGTSATRLVHDILAQCVTIDGEAQAPAAPPAVRVPPLDECLPERANGAKPKLPFPPMLPVDARARAAERRSCVQYLAVPADTVRRLQERSRAEGTTVNGALCAAAILAVRSALATDQNVSLQSQVSVREVLVPPVPNGTIGCFISGVTTIHQAAETASFWETARGVRRSIAAALERGDHLTVLKGRFNALYAFAIRHLGPRLNYGRTVALNVSNSGRFDMPLVYGPRQIRELYVSAAQHIIGATIQLAAWSVGGQMFVVCTHVRPLFSDAHAEAVARGFERLVARAGEPGDFSLRTMPAQAEPVTTA